MNLIRNIMCMFACGVAVGYAGDRYAGGVERQDLSMCPVFRKIMGLPRVIETVEPEIQKVEPKNEILPFGLKKDDSFDDSVLSVLSKGRRLKTKKSSPASTSELKLSDDDSDLSTCSTLEFSPMRRGCKPAWSVESLLACLEQMCASSEASPKFLRVSFIGDERSVSLSQSMSGSFGASIIGGDLRVSRSGEMLLTDLVRALSMRAQEDESVQSSGVFSQLQESTISVRSSAQWSEGDRMSLLELLPDLEDVLAESYKQMSLEELLGELKV